MKKFLIIVIVIILVILVGWWLLAKKESTPTDEISEILEGLKTVTGIDFSEIADTEFDWVVKVDPSVQYTIIQGKGFEANRISDEEFKSIASFFTDKEFEVDLYNMAAGTIAGMAGYKKDTVVCHFIGGVTGYKEAEGEWIPSESDKMDVEIKCGKLEGEFIEEQVSTTEQIIETKNEQEFSITLEANPTTGYQWDLDYDEDYLELVDRKYETLVQEGIVGAGGEEIFKFKALKSGETQITFSYLRTWEDSSIDEKVYEIVIK